MAGKKTGTPRDALWSQSVSGVWLMATEKEINAAQWVMWLMKNFYVLK